jgi:signal transduction histidine kinase
MNDPQPFFLFSDQTFVNDQLLMKEKTDLAELLAVLRSANRGDLGVRMGDGLGTEVATELNMLLSNLQRQDQALSTLASEPFFKNILDHVPIDIAIFSPQFKYLFINQQAMRDVELRKWIIGRTDFDYCRHRNVDERVAIERTALFEKVVETGKEFEFRQDLVQADKTSKAFLRRLSPVFGENGEIQMLIGCGLEITSQVEQDAQLLQKNKELEKTNAELDHFVYRASHEMRAPIASIAGLLDLVQAERRRPQAQRYLNLMGNAIVKMDTLIREIVDYSRNVRQPVAIGPINFEEMMPRVMEEVAHLDPKQLVNCSFHIDCDGPVIGDAGRIKILLTHLLSNSIKYHDPSKSSCWAKVEISASPENIEIVISDNGKGIAKQHQPKLFEMFFRATHEAFGSGLGLYIVAEVLEKLRGTVQLESNEGVGTSFRIVLPNGHAVESAS